MTLISYSFDKLQLSPSHSHSVPTHTHGERSHYRICSVASPIIPRVAVTLISRRIKERKYPFTPWTHDATPSRGTGSSSRRQLYKPSRHQTTNRGLGGTAEYYFLKDFFLKITLFSSFFLRVHGDMDISDTDEKTAYKNMFSYPQPCSYSSNKPG